MSERLVWAWIQVNVMALTDHDTMEGVPVALKVALELGIRLIPGVEISAKFASRFFVSSSFSSSRSLIYFTVYRILRFMEKIVVDTGGMFLRCLL